MKKYITLFTFILVGLFMFGGVSSAHASIVNQSGGIGPAGAVFLSPHHGDSFSPGQNMFVSGSVAVTYCTVGNYGTPPGCRSRALFDTVSACGVTYYISNVTDTNPSIEHRGTRSGNFVKTATSATCSFDGIVAIPSTLPAGDYIMWAYPIFGTKNVPPDSYAGDVSGTNLGAVGEHFTLCDGCSTNQAILIFNAAKDLVQRGSGTTLTWTSQNIASCSASDGWTGAKAVQGNSPTGNLDTTTTFTLSCLTNFGTTITRAVTIRAGAPASADIKANDSDGPITVTQGDLVRFNYTVAEIQACTVTQLPTYPYTDTIYASGARSYRMDHTRTITLRCTTLYGGNLSDAVTVNVIPLPPPPPPTYIVSVAKAGTGSGKTTQASGPGNPQIDCGSICTVSVVTGSVVKLHADPQPGSTFTGWSGAGCSGTADCTSTITSSVTVTATFNVGKYKLTVTKGGSGTGKVTSSGGAIDCGATCSKSNISGNTPISLSASATGGSTFTGWSGAGCSGTGACAFNITEDTTVIASFGPPDTTDPTTPDPVTASSLMVGGSPSCSDVVLSWGSSSDTNSGVRRYNIYRNGGASPVARVLHPTTSWIDSGRSGNTTYTYQVESEDNAGNTSSKVPVPSASVHTPACPSPTFTLSAAPATLSSILGGSVAVSSQSNVQVVPIEGFGSLVTLSVNQVCQGGACVSVPASACSAGRCALASTSPILPSSEFTFSRPTLSAAQYSLGSLFTARILGNTLPGTYGIVVHGSGGGENDDVSLILRASSSDPTGGEQ